MKGMKVKVAKFMHPIQIPGMSPRASIAIGNVDKMEFVSASMLAIEFKSKIIFVPVANIAMVVLDDQDEKQGPSQS